MNRVLVVDDDLSVIAAYRHVLEGLDSSNGFRQPTALVDLDAELFGQNGREKAEPIRLRVDFVDQGGDAIEAVRDSIARADPYAMVFLDLRMPPGLDGYETAEQIRKLDPDVQIVFVSAYLDYTAEELVSVAGPLNKVRILHKPVWPRELCAVVQQGVSLSDHR